MPGSTQPEPPDLPALEQVELQDPADGELELEGRLVERAGLPPLNVSRLRVDESELRGLTVEPGNVFGLTLSDAILGDCDLSNVQARGGSIRRVAVRNCRMVGFGFGESHVEDLRVVDSTLTLASFAYSELRQVTFERVNLDEVSFMQAQLSRVRFIDCRVDGADFRGAKLTECEIRGSSLDGVVGIDSLRGVTMPWADVVASAAALAAALGIRAEEE